MGEMVDRKTDIGASAFELPNGQRPEPRKPMFYGHDYGVVHTNRAAKITHPKAVMRAVIEGK